MRSAAAIALLLALLLQGVGAPLHAGEHPPADPDHCAACQVFAKFRAAVASPSLVVALTPSEVPFRTGDPSPAEPFSPVLDQPSERGPPSPVLV